MKLQNVKRSTPLLTTLILAGCVSYSGIEPQSTLTTPEALSMTAALTQWPSAKSWEILNDPVLSKLMEQALENNPSIKVAKARMAKVTAMVNVSESSRYPQAGVGVSSTEEHYTATGLYPPPIAGNAYSSNLLMVNAQYEFDFWGKNRDLLAAALSQEKAALAELHSARLLIETSVAKSYFTLADNLEQKKILQLMLAQREELFNVSKNRQAAGLETSQEMKSVQQGVPEMRAFIAIIDERIALARNALAALIGKGPASTADVVAVLPANITLPVPDSIPADLLGRRADISAARMRVEAASKQIDAGKTEFYPNINLKAFAGFSSLGFSRWLDGSSRDYGAGPAISLPIFDGGRLRAHLSSKTAEYDMAVESYNQTLIEAVHDVADQLSSLRALTEQQKQQTELLLSADSVYDIAQQREKVGLINRSAVLNAQSAVLNQQSIAIELRVRAVGLNINLVRALGGGFNEQTVFKPAAQNSTN